MPYIIRERRDVIDLRPIPVLQGPKADSYRWKMTALLDMNKNGELILPFSRRVVPIERDLWPRSYAQSLRSGYELCRCMNCENRTWTGHILQDDDDDEVSEYGNLHLELIYIESNTEKFKMNNEPIETSDENTDKTVEKQEEEEDDEQDNSSSELLSDPPSLFACGPY